MILNADDFGWTDGHNLAVEQAHRQGVLHRASLMCTGEAFFEAVEIARRLPKLSIGVHLTLNEGFPLINSKHLPNITNQAGMFYDEVVDLALLWLRGKLYSDEVALEWSAQLERALEAGTTLSHLDSHKHVHLLPPLLETIIHLAQKLQINYIRLPLEREFTHTLRRGFPGILLWLLARRARVKLRQAGMNFADHFIGIGHSGEMTAARLQAALSRSRDGLTEIMMHPAVITSAVMRLKKRYHWAARYRFEEELEALCSLRPGEI